MHTLGEYPRGRDLVKLYRRIREAVDIRFNEGALARLSAYYTLARHPNVGMERPSEEILREYAEEAISVARDIINEIEKIIQDP